MVHGETFLQVNETLPPGSYDVTVRTFIRAGFDTVSAGDEASAEFIIEGECGSCILYHYLRSPMKSLERSFMISMQLKEVGLL